MEIILRYTAILSVVQTVTALQEHSKRNHKYDVFKKISISSIHFEPPVDCTHVICPNIEDPVCIRVLPVLSNSVKNEPIFIRMINKCEINYLKCYQGIKAVIVRDKECNTQSSRLNKRQKRDLSDSEEENDAVVHSENDNNAEDNSVTGDNNSDNLGVDYEKDDYLEADNDATEHSKVENDYGAKCPEECAVARRVMICGKSKRGIYMTFLSRCHMRMFNCKHRQDQVSIISMRPCVQSAPFRIGDTHPVGVFDDYDTTDDILKAINLENLKRYKKTANGAKHGTPAWPKEKKLNVKNQGMMHLSHSSIKGVKNKNYSINDQSRQMLLEDYGLIKTGKPASSSDMNYRIASGEKFSDGWDSAVLTDIEAYGKGLILKQRKRI